MGGSEVTDPDFFVSYTGVDHAWAEWIAWTLEEANYRVVIQAWDFGAGSHFVDEMHRTIEYAARTVAVLSVAYLTSAYAAPEWQAAWAADPSGRARKLLVFRIEECPRPGLLAQLVSVDLFGVGKDVARRVVLAAAAGERGKPAVEPAFPGAGAVSGKRSKPDRPPPFPPSLRAVPLRPSFPGGSPEPLSLSEGEIQALASAFPTPVSARQVLDAAGVGVGRQPVWNAGTPEEFWREVSALFVAGIMVAGRESLLAAAYRQFPANRVFAANSSSKIGNIDDSAHQEADKWLEDLADLKRVESLIDESLRLEFQRKILSSRFRGHLDDGAG